MTVRENLAFGLKNIKIPKQEIADRIANASNILQLDNYLERLPQHLSGGQRQRVAIGRSIVSRSKVFYLMNLYLTWMLRCVFRCDKRSANCMNA